MLAMTMASSEVSRSSAMTTLRFDDDQRRRRCSWTGIEKKMIRTASASAYPLFLNQLNNDSPTSKYYIEVRKSARHMFAREITTQYKDIEISIAKVLLYVAAEDEAFLAFTREMDALSLKKEWESVQDQSDPSETYSKKQENAQDPSDPSETDSEELLLLGGKSISEWLSEIDAIAKEVEVELASRDIDLSSSEVLKAVNVVLFDLRGFKRTSIEMATDPKYFYLHSLLNCRCGTAFLFSVISIEVCQLLGVPIMGSRVGEDFLDLDIVTNRDIIGIALANLIRVYWRRASKDRLVLTSPLRDSNNIGISEVPLLRPEDMRLAIAAAERLLLLDLQNWRVRRDLGLLLYYLRQYGEAIQELSVCIAFATDGEEELKNFVKKLHVIRHVSSSLKSPLGSDPLTIP